MAIGMTRAALVRRGITGLAAGAGALALGACGVTGDESQSTASSGTKQPVKLVLNGPRTPSPSKSGPSGR